MATKKKNVKVDNIDNEINELRKELFKEEIIEWDVKKDAEIPFFDPTLSYEITHYRPVDENHGFDFDPSWFTKVREIKLQTGKYCSFPFGTKRYHDFWQEEHRKCVEGMTSHGYRITGDHYFFLNYYQLPESQVKKAGQGRGFIFPSFASKQYEYFHYIDLCRYLKKDVVAVKARACGFSEIGACLGVNAYSTRKHTHSVYSAFTDKYVSDILKKCWTQLENLNANSEGGMRHVRQKVNTAYHKRASKINKQREELPNSWGADIEGIVVDDANKLRGDRIDMLFFEEAGSNPILKETWIKGNALVVVGGNKIGTRIAFGTGGDVKTQDQLEDMFYNPLGFDVLPYRHNYTEDGEYVLTGFFIPAYCFLLNEDAVDDRGVTNTKFAKEYYQKKRDKLISLPDEYVRECAEFCFTPQEAFLTQGDNLFDKQLLALQASAIKLKQGPIPERGSIEYKFKNGVVKESEIESTFFKPDIHGHTHIIEKPQTDANDKVPANLYVAGIDGIDLGQEDTSAMTRDPSQFCVVVLRRAYGVHPPKIVAYYMDRPRKIEQAHIACLRLLQYYNAQACLESTRISLLQYFRSKHCENKYLMRRPRSCQSDIQNGRSKQFGAPAIESIIRHQLELIGIYVDNYCGEIWFEEVVKQLLTYSFENKTKFDIVAALGMAMLADEELMFVQPKVGENQVQTFQDFGYWKDERGIIHKGIIPKEPQYQTNVSFDTRIRNMNDYYGYERLRASYTRDD